MLWPSLLLQLPLGALLEQGDAGRCVMRQCMPCAQILYGNLAPEGCVGKITGKEGLLFEGRARVYDSEEDMLAALSEDPQSFKVRLWRMGGRLLLSEACRAVRHA